MSGAPPTLEPRRWDPTPDMTPPDEAWGRIQTALFVARARRAPRIRPRLLLVAGVGLGIAAASLLQLVRNRAENELVSAGVSQREADVPGAPQLLAPAERPTPAPSAAPEPTVERPLRRRHPPAPGAAPSMPVGSLDLETEQLARALHQLRVERKPVAALETLGNYKHRFPAGLLSREALLVELDANVALGRSSRALELIDDALASGGGQPRAAELELLHAAILVNLDRCEEARSSLDRRIEAGSGSARLDARALYLRALCAAKAGDSTESRRDLEEYLRRFPGQADRAAVAEALHRLGGP
jgi:tetratricopeptide (TPR) repeat protein